MNEDNNLKVKEADSTEDSPEAGEDLLEVVIEDLMEDIGMKVREGKEDRIDKIEKAEKSDKTGKEGNSDRKGKEETQV